MQEKIEKLRSIANDATLSPAQKKHYLALEAENLLPYPALDPDTQQALDERVICDMYEGHAPYKPRYVLPDYGIVLKHGSKYLELPVPETLLDCVCRPTGACYRPCREYSSVTVATTARALPAGFPTTSMGCRRSVRQWLRLPHRRGRGAL